MPHTYRHQSVMPERVCFPIINTQGSLINKICICLCVYLLSRHTHIDAVSIVEFLIQHGVSVQHVACIPLYFAFFCWVSVVIPSCIMYYTQIKALHQYIIHMLIVFIGYYSIILACMLYRPKTASPLCLIIAVHVLEKAMINTGERVLYGGQHLPSIFKLLSLSIICFSWLYLPIHVTSTTDLIACLFAAELFGIVIVFTYHIMIGSVTVIVHAYKNE
jgi:hypothetical protein